MRYSIVIPMYNSEKYLNQCIMSVIKQDCSNYEVLLIDDGSTDKTRQIADSYSNQYDYIHCFHFENGGSVEARRRGARIAKGEYIVYLDSDDFIAQDFISTIDGIVNKYNSPDMIVLGFSRADNEGNLNGIKIHNNVPEGIYCGRDKDLITKKYIYDSSLPGMNYGSIHFSVCTKITKRHLYLKLQDKIDERISLGDDMVLTKCILQDDDCKTIVVDNYDGYIYRDNAASMTNNVNIQSFKKYDYAIIELRKLDDVGYDNRTCVHALRALCGILSLISHKSGSYHEFYESVKDSYRYETIWSYARKAVVYRPSIKDFVKMVSIRFKLYRLFYFASRNSGNKNSQNFS